jgi:hypothetical protein
MMIRNTSARYRFLKGIAPYSCGVIADPGWEIVRVTLAKWLPWNDGFEFVERYLKQAELTRSALCAMELRSPAPFTMQGFIDFNRDYCEVLESWGLLLESLNPIARTNVAPICPLPATPSLHAFSFVRPNPLLKRKTFVVAGAGELREGVLRFEAIIRRGEVMAEAIRDKASFVLDVMDQRLAGMELNWSDATAVTIYTIHPLEAGLRAMLLDRIGLAARHGICWHVSQPPVQEIEFEMDVRGIATEIAL